jgi:hypothetical protein
MYRPAERIIKLSTKEMAVNDVFRGGRFTEESSFRLKRSVNID